jgi:hypothetical protein
VDDNFLQGKVSYNENFYCFTTDIQASKCYECFYCFCFNFSSLNKSRESACVQWPRWGCYWHLTEIVYSDNHYTANLSIHQQSGEKCSVQIFVLLIWIYKICNFTLYCVQFCISWWPCCFYFRFLFNLSPSVRILIFILCELRIEIYNFLWYGPSAKKLQTSDMDTMSD